ncbi:head decoration protein [Nocardioides sp.]|uniref:head decoration protein n=1 Tax=Nocardioides sp. TaxID=35761 RepID=UPI0026243DF0|nr:head decoration protein [Nocardioides sp.]
MTDIGVYETQFQSENLAWDLSSPGVPFTDGGTLDVSLFTQAQHFAKGYIPAGTVLGKKTSTGLLGPYLNTASDGRETAVGILRASVHVIQPNGTQKAKVGCALLKAFAVISVSKLPFTSATAAAGGYIDTAGQADLPTIFFAA